MARQQNQNFFLPRSALAQVFRQTRTRILLLYVFLMLVFMGLSVPLFRHLIERQVSLRVREDLVEARENFMDAYLAWEKSPNQTQADLKVFVDEFLANQLPEDDNFLIILIDQKLYRSNPSRLFKPLRPDSKLFQYWLRVNKYSRGEWLTQDPRIEKIIYKADPLFLEGKQQGIFIVAHTTAGEQSEALASVYIFAQVAAGVLFLSCLLAWFGTGWLLAPVRELAKTARNISESDLSQRLSVQGTGELADLSQIFNAMMNRLQSAFDSQRRFVNDAGHELRTPITIVRGHLELIDGDPKEQQETIELVLDELDRMGRLVNDMIALAKSERPDFLQCETIELSPFVQDLFAKAQTLADRNWHLSSQGSGTIVADRQRLTGALLNLLRNAAQHTQPTDVIELGYRQMPAQVRFWVQDTGDGISIDDQHRIFDRFARIEGQRVDGSGLGLAIVKAFTEAHQGTIELVSQQGSGSTFILTLPRQQGLETQGSLYGG
ncbi:Sensor kinase CusS [Acaryochloris thomasi RCC1774]|uniref:histidine kinase n=1 Tax=Acaryochloris thomasi RCC1774 TaxID=1764569 RepID=A0A2W1JIX6_9CYAN|nr:ATP-binding protein [Acaryochloris thomasi]PZD73443.1 Sensor kinase CusS [Acaryochloris thomasi RCC1774]